MAAGFSRRRLAATEFRQDTLGKLQRLRRYPPQLAADLF